MYTYDDIICVKDTLTGKVKKEDVIGKKGWFTDVLRNMKKAIDENNFGFLVDETIDHIDDADVRFVTNADTKWDYFIPKKERSYIGRQAEWIEANNLKPGDKVRILRRFGPHEDGFCTSMGSSMEDLVDKVLTVRDTNTTAIRVWNKDFSDFWAWPYFVLEKVEDEPETEDGPEDAKPVFKVGDRVRIVKEWAGFEDGCDPTVGETGKIDFIGDTYIKVVLDSDGDWWVYKPDAVEIIKDEPAYIPFDLSDPKDRDFLRGKWVRSKNPDVFNEFEIAHFVRVNNTNQDIKVETSNGISYFAEELLCDYEFLDGSPVGKKSNNK